MASTTSTDPRITGATATVPSTKPRTGTNSTLVDNAQIVTNTTTVDKTIGSVVTGVSVIPYMRALAIDFVGYRLRPEREIWFYFDGVSVNRLIQKPNVIKVASSNVVSDLRAGNQKTLKIGSSSARILHVERSLDTGNAVFYVSEFDTPAEFAASATVTVKDTSYSTSLISYEHQSGFLRLNSSNDTIFFALDANGTTDDYYVGNTITIVNGSDAGQSAEIISYNCATKTAYVEPELKINPKDDELIYTIGDYRSWYSSNTYPSTFTTSRGIVSGVFHVPDPNKNPEIRFRTGERTFRIVDNPYYGINDPEFGVGSVTTKAQYRFVSNGLEQSVAQLIERSRDEDIAILLPPPTPSTTRTVSRTPSKTPITKTPTRSITPTQTPDPSPTPSPTYTTPPPSQSKSRSPIPTTRTPQVPPVTSPKPPVTTPPPSKSKSPSVPPTKSRTPSCRPKFTYWREPGKDGNCPYGSCSRCVSCCQTYGDGDDPIAQSFFVSAVESPDGVFVSSVDLFFKNKGELLPVEVQIRPVENGIPRNDKIIPGATTIVDIEDINVSNFPNTSNSLTATRFTFPSPVYLNAGYEYAIVAVTDDFGYDYYSAELGGTVLGTDRKISKQPFLGSFFKSQSNGKGRGTWTPLQNEDLMFVLNKCNFTSTSGTAIFEEDKVAMRRELTANVDYNSFDEIKANTYYDAFELRSDAIEINNTKLQYYFKGASNTSKILASTYTNFDADRRFDLEERNLVFNPQLANKSMSVRIDMSTKNPDVSPIIYHNRQNMVTIENLINDTGLTADRFTITNPGSNYDTTNAYVTITSNVGYGANAWAVASDTTGTIVGIYVDSPGVGYVDDVTATIGGGSGTGATVSVSSETSSSGGPALARYISKTVTLIDGFDAGDLRVFLTAVKPPGSNVNVYYKVRNALDPQKIEDRDWVRMTQKTSQYTFSVNRQPVEYEYRPSLTSNNITYSTDTTTYKTFNQFAIKIVLSSRSTVANSIPYVLDVRATALPEDAY